MSTLKQKIHQECVTLVDQNIAMHQKAMNDAQDAANKEQRSTAGDKYDTSRAMSQNERDMFARRLVESLQMKKVLDGIDATRSLDKAESGALVIASTGNFYLSASFGKISVDGGDYFTISPITPAGQAMLGKGVGETFEVNGQLITIEEIS